MLPAPEAARERLIVALDFPSASDALRLVDRLERRCLWFKVGLELYLAAGGSLVSTLRQRGYNVFLDLKLHDIPNTVAGAIRSIAPLGANLLTIHAAGGEAMLTAAADAVAAISGAPRLLAVTVLTSFDEAQLATTGVNGPVSDQVHLLAAMAHRCGIDGLICSADEVAGLRSRWPDSLLITPGIRPAGADTGDQSRIATPARAIALGASKLVVGRPITQAGDPAEAAEAILNEIANSDIT